MKRFMMKSLLCAALMFISVLLGMQLANDGIKRMQGYNDPALGSAFTLTEGKEGNFQASILGEKVTSHDIEEKKKKLEQINSYNFFSSTGKKIADGITSAADKTIELITKNE